MVPERKHGFVKSQPIRDHEARKLWRMSLDRCACCWRPADWRGSHLQVHHIVKAGRSDEPCNWIGFCFTWQDGDCRCHDLAEGHTIRRPDRTVWPTLSLANVLWFKREAHPDEYDALRLEQLYHKRLPEPERPHECFFEARRRYSRLPNASSR